MPPVRDATHTLLQDGGLEYISRGLDENLTPREFYEPADFANFDNVTPDQNVTQKQAFQHTSFLLHKVR
jgi:hypothetical protein